MSLVSSAGHLVGNVVERARKIPPFKTKVTVYQNVQRVLKTASKVITFPSPEMFTGVGSSLKLCEHIAAQGVKNILLVTDSFLLQSGLITPIQDKLASLGVAVTAYDGIKPDPTIAQIETGLALLKAKGCTAIIAVGGGSSMDAAKVIAARANNPHKIAHMGGLFRVIFKPMSLYVVPTTAGTGSEVTIAAVVSDPDNKRKFAIMDPKLVPVAAALDGGLMTGLPPAITAATGMDALTHAVEAYISNNHTPTTDDQALRATRLIMQNLPKVMKDGQDLEARQNMAQASCWAGQAFTVAGVGYVHAIAHNFGAYYHIPHGLANAIILPKVLEFSKPNCIQRLATLAEVSGLKQGGESPSQLADAFIAHVKQLNAAFGIPTHVEKLKASDIPAIAKAALREAHWTYAVPRYMNQADCERFIAQMLVN
jgi:alcohol dehydrogenase class IV